MCSMFSMTSAAMLVALSVNCNNNNLFCTVHILNTMLSAHCTKKKREEEKVHRNNVSFFLGSEFFFSRFPSYVNAQSVTAQKKNNNNTETNRGKGDNTILTYSAFFMYVSWHDSNFAFTGLKQTTHKS